MSTKTTDAQVVAAMAMGANAFVFKPVTIEELEGHCVRRWRPDMGEGSGQRGA